MATCVGKKRKKRNQINGKGIICLLYEVFSSLVFSHISNCLNIWWIFFPLEMPQYIYFLTLNKYRVRILS